MTWLSRLTDFLRGSTSDGEPPAALRFSDPLLALVDMMEEYSLQSIPRIIGRDAAHSVLRIFAELQLSAQANGLQTKTRVLSSLCSSSDAAATATDRAASIIVQRNRQAYEVASTPGAMNATAKMVTSSADAARAPDVHLLCRLHHALCRQDGDTLGCENASAGPSEAGNSTRDKTTAQRKLASVDRQRRRGDGWAGALRCHNVRVGTRSCCPAAQLGAELTTFLETYEEKLLRRPDVHPVSKAAALMLGVIEIHPFADGNGRLGRLLFSWAMVQHGRLPFSIVLCASEADRRAYIRCIKLAVADPKQHFRTLLRFCARVVASTWLSYVGRVRSLSSVPLPLPPALLEALAAGQRDAAEGIANE